VESRRKKDVMKEEGEYEGGRKQLVQDRFSAFKAVKAYEGSEAVVPFILNFHTSCSELLASFSDCFPHGKAPEDAGWDPEPIWRLWRRDKSLVCRGNRTIIHQSSSPLRSHNKEWVIPASR
jgi:hypothetical protein